MEHRYYANEERTSNETCMTTSNIKVMMLDEQAEDTTIVIQKIVPENNYARRMMQGNNNPRTNNLKLQELAGIPMTLIRTAKKVEEAIGVQDNVPTRTSNIIEGLKDIYKYTELENQGFMASYLALNIQRLDTAFPSQVECVVLSGFGLREGLMFLAIILNWKDDALSTVTYTTDRGTFINREGELVQEETLFYVDLPEAGYYSTNCINYWDCDSECGEDTDKDVMDTDKDGEDDDFNDSGVIPATLKDEDGEDQ